MSITKAIVHAGGQGTRLYPYSTINRPKQFCNLSPDETFVQATVSRLQDVGLSINDIFVVTTSDIQSNLANEQLANNKYRLPRENILVIPDNLDFAGAMLEATRIIAAQSGGAITLHTPSDQYIPRGDANFAASVKKAIAYVETNRNQQVVVGVNTQDLNLIRGCGHALYSAGNDKHLTNGIYPVEEFIEKPNLERAKKLQQNGNFACNTAITCWDADFIGQFATSQNLYGRKLITDELMSKLGQGLHVVTGNFRWEDCGTLASLWDISSKSDHNNVYFGTGTVRRKGNSNCLFITPDNCKIYATRLKNTAVVVNRIDDQVVVAVVNLAESQVVKDLAGQLTNNALLNVTGINAYGNRLSHFDLASGKAMFAGVNDHVVHLVDCGDGSIEVHVSGESLTQS